MLTAKTDRGGVCAGQKAVRVGEPVYPSVQTCRLRIWLPRHAHFDRLPSSAPGRRDIHARAPFGSRRAAPALLLLWVRPRDRLRSGARGGSPFVAEWGAV